MKDIKFIRNDIVKLHLGKFIENGSDYYITIGKASKLEQAEAFSSIDGIDYNDLSNGILPKNLKTEDLANLTYSQIAVFIVDTNLIDEKLTLENKINLIRDLDSKCPELIEFLQEQIDINYSSKKEDNTPKLIKKR